jgi:hypothetical protein
MAMPPTLTVLPTPAFLSIKLAVVLLAASTSPATRLSPSVTVAAVPPSYTRFCAVAPTVRARCVMLAVVAAVVLKL